MELGEEPLVQTAAAIFRELCYNYRDSLVAGILVAGWDKKKGGMVYQWENFNMNNRLQSTFRRVYLQMNTTLIDPSHTL